MLNYYAVSISYFAKKSAVYPFLAMYDIDDILTPCLIHNCKQVSHMTDTTVAFQYEIFTWTWMC